MAIVEILMLDVPPTFTVDTAVDEVTVTQAPPPAGFFGYFTNGIPRDYFPVSDHVKLLSIMLRLPYCFHQSTGIPNFVFSWEEANGPSEQSVTELGGLGWLNIPASGMEFGLGDIKAQWDGAAPVISAGNKARIGLKGYTLSVSMIGVPASLDTTEQEIQLALKVLHTEDMVV